MDLVPLAIIVGVGAAIYFIYETFFRNKGEEVLVEYAELVNNVIVEHPKLYKGVILNNKDMLVIPALRLERPKPPSEVLRPTNGKLKKLGYIKIDEDRYAYRIPSLNNQVFTYKRDNNGHIQFKDEKRTIPKIVKKKWQYCDDIKEPHTKHWERYRIKELQEKHKQRDKWLSYLPAISMAVIFIFAVIALQLTSKNFMADKESIMERADTTQKESQKTVEALNRVMDRVSGKTEVPNEQNPQPPPTE